MGLKATGSYAQKELRVKVSYDRLRRIPGEIVERLVEIVAHCYLTASVAELRTRFFGVVFVKRQNDNFRFATPQLVWNIDDIGHTFINVSDCLHIKSSLFE